MNKSWKFLSLLCAVLILVFGVHLLALYAQSKPLLEHKIILAYLVNFVLAAIILFLVQKNMKANSAQAGFIFFAGSGLKFLAFFLVFYPSYQQSGAMETSEFITFFVPYSICLILEVYYLSKQLNNQSA